MYTYIFIMFLEIPERKEAEECHHDDTIIHLQIPTNTTIHNTCKIYTNLLLFNRLLQVFETYHNDAVSNQS